MTEDPRPPVLELRGVSKSSGTVTAVRDVSLALRPGEVHVLLGGNGAEKSTLGEMMAGVHEPTAGTVLVDGSPVRIGDVRHAEALGIATIHQQRNLVPTLSVAGDVLLGRHPRRFGLVGALGVARQPLVEIAKALSLDTRVLVLDEPTAALTRTELHAMFPVLRQLRASGVAMVFMSHHLAEIAEIGDRVTVIRNGTTVAEVAATTTERELVQLVVGRDIAEQFPPRSTERGEPVLEKRGLSRAGAFEDVTLTVHAVEVLGLAGLVGAGRTEVLRAVAGADACDGGEVLVRGTRLRPHDVAAAVTAGIGHVPEDRKQAGLVLGASASDNLGYATVARTARFGLVDLRGQRRRAEEVAARLRVRMRSAGQPVGSLSGGNQQKVVFGRWVLAGSTVLLPAELGATAVKRALSVLDGGTVPTSVPVQVTLVDTTNVATFTS